MSQVFKALTHVHPATKLDLQNTNPKMKLLRISRQWLQSIKPQAWGPSKTWALYNALVHAHDASPPCGTTRRQSILETAINAQGEKWTAKASRKLAREDSQVAKPGSETDENHLQKELPTLSVEILRTSLILGTGAWKEELESSWDQRYPLKGITSGGREVIPKIPFPQMLDGEGKKRSKQ